MAITVQCPVCKSQRAVIECDDAMQIVCAECIEHSLRATAGNASTTITASANANGAARAAVWTEPGEDTGAVIKRRPVWIASVIGLRLGAPASWTAALAMFFLPWVDIKCVDNNGAAVSHCTISGAQIITGSCTQVSPAPTANDRAGAKGLRERDARQQWAAWLLAIYASGLFVAVVNKGIFVLTKGPNVLCAGMGGIASVCFLLLMFLSVFLALDNPLRVPRQVNPVVKYTFWYYCSYLANLMAILFFAAEWWLARHVSCRYAAPTGARKTG